MINGQSSKQRKPMLRRGAFMSALAALPAFIAFVLPIGLVLACLGALWLKTSSNNDLITAPLNSLFEDIYIRRAVIFTLTQATLSALLSALLAIPLARALAHRNFPGRGLFITFLGAPFILPVIVAILGILAIWGRTGLINQLFSNGNQPTITIYGLTGILIAHVFFNLPLATRMLLQGWQAIPVENWRLATQLGLPSHTIARHIEWPMIRERLPGIFALIFLLCAASFTVVLALGGGPKATTIELAIYQAIRFDFDLDRAAWLALLQIILCAGLAIAVRLLARDHETSLSLGGTIHRPDLNTLGNRLFDGLIILTAILFLGLPLCAAILRGVWNLFSYSLNAGDLIAALGRSLWVSMLACITMLLISLPLAYWSAKLQGPLRRLLELPGFAILVAPPIALGAGLFLLIHRFVPVDAIALPLTGLLNGLQTVPFALILLTPALSQINQNYNKLMTQLGLPFRVQIRYILWPSLRRPLGLSLGLTGAMAMGDLGIIALFGSPSAPTLPLYLYQLMGAYRMDQAYAVGVLLTLAALLLFWIFDRGLGGHDHTE